MTKNNITDSATGFKAGLMHGLPIGMGYLSVSFSFGVMAVSSGLFWWQAVLISLLNVTSAGQVAGVNFMTTSGRIIELVLSQLVINMRYSLMGISLSQKADKSVNKLARIFLSFAITDEIFGVASSHDSFGRKYLFGLQCLPIVGWVAGTLFGSLLGSVMPQILTDSLSIGIYGMFIAIVLPVARKESKIAFISIIAIILSCVFAYVKALSFISGGLAVIISAVIAAAIGAFVMPLEKKEEKADA